VIKLLYVVLVLSTIAVLGVAGVIYWRVRRHLSASASATAGRAPSAGEPGEGGRPAAEQARRS